MPKDTHTMIFWCKMEAIVLSILQTFCNAREKMFANSLPFVTWEVYFSVFSSRIL